MIVVMRGFQSVLLLLGRVGLAMSFFYLAYQKITHWDDTVAYLASWSVPETSLVLFVATIIELFGAISLILGIKVRWGAALLALYLIPYTVLFHGYWYFVGTDVAIHTILLLHAIALFGGLLYVVVTGAGSLALDQE